MNQLIVAKAGVAYGAKQGGGTIANDNEIDLLAEGAIAIFLKEGSTLTYVNAATAASVYDGMESFMICQGTIDGKGNLFTRKTNLIPTPMKVAVSKSYAAPAAKVMRVGYSGSTGSLNLPASLVVGDVATLKIYREFQEESNDPLWNTLSSQYPHVEAISVQVRVTSGMTQDTLVAALVAKINAHAHNQGAQNYVVASVAGTYAGTNLAIVLTGQFFYQDFLVAVDDLLAEADTFTTTALDFGHGEGVQLKVLEDLYGIEDGDTARIKYPTKWYNVPSYVVIGSNYRTWEFQYNWGVAVNNIPLTPMAGVLQRVTLGVVTGDAVATALDTIFGNMDFLGLQDGDAW